MDSITQTGPCVPRSNAGFGNWVSVMSKGIAKNPALYAMTQADADVLVQSAQQYLAAHTLTTNEGTRTKVTVRNRDSIRAAITPLFTTIAQRIKHHDGISDADKINIGVRPQVRSHSKRAAPSSSPVLKIVGAGHGTHTIRYHDSLTEHSSAKPFGAVALQLFVDITDGSRQPSLGEARFIGLHSRNNFGLEHEAIHAGKQATYWGQWVTMRGEVGPWSAPVSFTIAFGDADAHARASVKRRRSNNRNDRDDDAAMKLAA